MVGRADGQAMFRLRALLVGAELLLVAFLVDPKIRTEVAGGVGEPPSESAETKAADATPDRGDGPADSPEEAGERSASEPSAAQGAEEGGAPQGGGGMPAAEASARGVVRQMFARSPQAGPQTGGAGVGTDADAARRDLSGELDAAVGGPSVPPPAAATAAAPGRDTEPNTGAGTVRGNIVLVWASMHQHRIWRPMIFVCVFSLAPGNGDAFNSFLLGNPAARADQVCADAPLCPELGNSSVPFCPESPTCPPEPPVWPADRPPLYFSDSDYAYVNFVANVGSIFGIFLFKRYLRNASWRPMFLVVILISTALSMVQLILIFGSNLSSRPQALNPRLRPRHTAYCVLPVVPPGSDSGSLFELSPVI
jgi:hypothetical protein